MDKENRTVVQGEVILNPRGARKYNARMFLKENAGTTADWTGLGEKEVDDLLIALRGAIRDFTALKQLGLPSPKRAK